MSVSGICMYVAQLVFFSFFLRLFLIFVCSSDHEVIFAFIDLILERMKENNKVASNAQARTFSFLPQSLVEISQIRDVWSRSRTNNAPASLYRNSPFASEQTSTTVYTYEVLIYVNTVW